MATFDRPGSPLTVSTHTAKHHEATLVHLNFGLCTIEAKPQRLVGFRPYDSDALGNGLKKEGGEMIALYRSDRNMQKHDARSLHRYARRVLSSGSFPGCN